MNPVRNLQNGKNYKIKIVFLYISKSYVQIS